jgi:hypothetical protein
MILVGGVLTVAVVMKITGGPVKSEQINLFSPAVKTVALQAEIVVAIWLLTGWARETSRLAAVTLFAMLAGASLTMVISGVSDCGCFGAVSVNPWMTLLLDIACVALLMATQPQGWTHKFRTSASVVCGLGLLAFCTAGVLTSSTGLSALARFRGESLQLVTPVVNIGDATVGETRTARFELTNHSGTDIDILGGTLRCSCMATDTLRFTVPAHGTASFNIEVTYKGSPGWFSHDFELFAADGGRRTISGRITGTVVETQP